MHAQGSKILPSTDKFDLRQKGVGRFIKCLLKASNSYYWDHAINIEKVKGAKSLLQNPRETSMDYIKAEAEV